MNNFGFSPKALPVVVVIVGTTLSFLGAIVPHHDSAHRLLPSILASGLTLYAVYAVLAGIWSSPRVRKWGLRVLGAHAAVVLLSRPLFGNETGSILIGIAPLLLAVPVLRLWPSALRATDLEARAKPD